MNGLSLFSGIGGLDLAFEWAGGTITAMCEIEPYCQKVLRKHWPHVPLFEDIKEVHALDVGTVDVIYGGFPCQPFSVAGKQKGQNDSRYLWPEFSRLVSDIKPRWVVAENVPGILRISADDVCSDLERQGYSVGIWDFEAAAVGALHRRERVFFVAHSGCSLWQRSFKQRTLSDETGERTSYKSQRPGCSFVPDSCCKRCKEQQQPFQIEQEFSISGCHCGGMPQSYLGRMVNGVSSELDNDRLTFWNSVPEPHERTINGIKYRTNRLKALGNAVVPQQAYPVFKAIIDADEQIQQDFQHQD